MDRYTHGSRRGRRRDGSHWRVTIAVALAAAMLPAATAANAAETATDPDCLRTIGGLDLQTATVLDLQAALEAGTITSAALVEQTIARIAAFDGPVELPARDAEDAFESEQDPPWLNSVRSLAPDAIEQAVALDAERAASGARGPLHGVTVLLKDNVGTVDLPTTAGSIALADNVPPVDATIAARMREAGAIILGKTNLSEFANWMSPSMPSGYSSLGGQVVAPYRFDLNPSGSSSGSGVAGTMAFATLTIGTETSGSIISPATRNSLVGVKPTLGLVSRVGVIPLAHSFDTAGPMTRTVTDAAAMLQAIAYADPLDDAAPAFEDALGGEVPDYLARLDPAALDGVRLGVRESDLLGGGLFGDAVGVLESLGATIVSIDDAIAAASFVSLFEVGAISNEFKLYLNQYLASEASPDIPVDTLSDIIEFNDAHPGRIPYGQGWLQLTDAQTGSEYDPVYVASREAAIAGAQSWIDLTLSTYDVDAIVGPGGANTSVTAAAGYPNITVPMGYVDQEPQGIAFAGGAFTEADLLAYAYAYEQGSLARVAPTEANPDLVVPCPTAATDGEVDAEAAVSAPAGPAAEPASADPALPTTGGGVGLALLPLAALAARRSRRRSR